MTFYACVALDRTISNADATKPPLRLPCTAPWRAPVVAYDGSVLPCCWDARFADWFYVIGNSDFQKLRLSKNQVLR